MKSSGVKLLIILAAVAVPLFVWAAITQPQDIRGRAQSLTPSPTPMACNPSATPPVTCNSGYYCQLSGQGQAGWCIPNATATNTPTSASTPTAIPTITPTPTNSPPRCLGLSAQPGSGAKPLTVNFACAGYDNNNDIIAAEFGFGGNQKQTVQKNVGQYGAITATYTYTTPGSYNVTCHLEDNNMAWSSYPGYCTYTVVVTDNALTPTPYYTPVPTQVITIDSGPVIYNGGFPTLAPYPTSTPVQVTTIRPTPTPKPFWWSGDKIAQLVEMIIVSGVTIIVALMLHAFFDRR